MRSVLLHEGYTEEEVKPSEQLARYRALTEADVRGRLAGGVLHDRACPACGATDAPVTGDRFGLTYRTCAACGSLHVSPAPDDAALMAYYRESEAETYWRRELSRQAADARRARIVAPRVAWISDAVSEYRPDARALVDVQTHYAPYVPALCGIRSIDRLVLADPVLPEAEIPDVPSSTVTRARLGEDALADSADVVTLFEVLDRVADADALMAKTHAALRAGGLCFVTGILGSGLEYQELGTRSSNLLPPDRLNLFTVEGLQTLAERHGFEVIEFSTPGNFDVRTLDAALAADPTLPVSTFVRYVLEKRSPSDKLLFQEFLQAGLLSAYGRLVLRKTR